MRRHALVLLCQLIFTSGVWAQSSPPPELPLPARLDIPDVTGPSFSSSDRLMFSDSGILNTIGSIFKDDERYYSRAPIYVPLMKIVVSNAALVGIDRYVFNYDFSRISLASWKHNIDTGWVWDDDRFGINFFFHPYTGGGYYMDARSMGYNYYESIPFAMFGSVIWEYLGETTAPSYNDLINTSINGSFIGEVGYRLTSNILDDRATGEQRAWREAVSALISPSRFFSRLITGKLWEVSDNPSLEQEPMDVNCAIGLHRVNNGTNFATGANKLSINMAIEYGDPFEARARKPFDEFKIYGELTNAYERKLLGDVTGYGLLTGTNVKIGNVTALLGIFQHFDYFDNLAFEFGDLAFGGGILAKLPITTYHNLYSNLHLSIIPMGANNTGYAPIDTTQVRDYSYGDGVQAMTETGISLGDRLVDISVIVYWMYFHSYVGDPIDNSIVLLKPRVAIRLWKNLGIGLEHQLYSSNRTATGVPTFSIQRTEQRLFVQWNWDDFRKE